MDFKKLVEALKLEGLDVAEDMAALLVKAVFNFVEEQVRLSPNKYDDMLLAIMPTIRKLILEQVDKIDGEVDPPEAA